MITQRTCPAILAIGTAVPPNRVKQAALCDWMAAALAAQPSLARWLRHLYRASGIETRYSCLADADAAPEESRFAPGRAADVTPSTAERMAIYERAAMPLGVAAARQALAEQHTDTSAVTHLLVVSCTGFFAPGLDLAIVQQLGLRLTVERTIIGFMGCAAAFNALRLADQIVRAQPAARVLVVCVELCSLHVQPVVDRVNLTVASLFADGASACLVALPTRADRDIFVIDQLYTHFVPDTEGEMAWRIGNHGFQMRLSPQIPRLLGQVAPHALQMLLDGRPQPQHWAIHPGGRSIIDHLEQVLALTPEQVAPSRAVLRDYGNMSSATILFVLRDLRQRLQAKKMVEERAAVAMAFGPGLVAEMAHLTYQPVAALPSRANGHALKGAAVGALA